MRRGKSERMEMWAGKVAVSLPCVGLGKHAVETREELGRN